MHRGAEGVLEARLPQVGPIAEKPVAGHASPSEDDPEPERCGRNHLVAARIRSAAALQGVTGIPARSWLRYESRIGMV